MKQGALDFPASQRLKSRKNIEKLFEEGKSLLDFPIKLMYLPLSMDTPQPTQAAFGVSKRKLKRAVDRNRTKRLMREAYRLNKQNLFNSCKTPYALMFLYLGNSCPDFDFIQEKMKTLITRLIKNVSS